MEEIPPRLEFTVTLGDIIDSDSLKCLCMSFSRSYRIGVLVIDKFGEILIDVPYDNGFCEKVKALKSCHDNDCSLKDVIQTTTKSCFCGLRFKTADIKHQDEHLGQLVVGPYRMEEDQFSDDIKACLEAEERATGIENVKSDFEKINVETHANIDVIISGMLDVLSVVIQAGYARHLTSQIHIAAIQDAYNELTEKNRRLADSVEKLKDLDKLKSSFLATISHELRTPLTSVIGYSEMLIEGFAGELNAEQGEYAKTILDKGNHLLKIINEILEISKIESGSISLKEERFDVSELIRQVADAMMPQARKKDISLTYNAENGLPLLIADRPKVRQVLINLVSNAIKFTPAKGAVQLRASVNIRDEGHKGGSYIDLTVIDSGIGVEDHVREEIFEAFYQVDSSSTREYGGTGLGLSIVKHFVEAHGGKVWVENPGSDDRRGSLFIAQFPLKR